MHLKPSAQQLRRLLVPPKVQVTVVLLSAPASEALLRQKAHTYLQGGHVFHDPKTNAPWKCDVITDVRSFWQVTLKRLASGAGARITCAAPMPRSGS